VNNHAYKPLAVALLLSLVVASVAVGQTTAVRPVTAKVVLLGTGTPRPFPERSGPATAIVVDDKPYLVDFGPGVIRRAAAAAAQGTPALEVTKLTVAFLTHLHSDHTVGYPDLIFTPWVMGRKEELNVYGPEGIEEMTKHVMRAWQQDIDIRTKGLERADPVLVRAHDVKPGVVYKDDKVKVTAFRVPHGEWPQAFGYRFDAPGRTIVISGDTSPSSELVANCQKCDVLIHETYSPSSVAPAMPDWNGYRAKYHTSTEQLAEIANRSKPALLIVYHVAGRGPNGRIPEEQLLQEIQKTYHGKVVIGHDLEIY
jgi:ribonuclease BN (tRNA processing enzyme)